MKLFQIFVSVRMESRSYLYLINGIDIQNALMRVFESNSILARDIKTKMRHKEATLQVFESDMNPKIDDDI